MLAETTPTLYDAPAHDVASAEALDLAERFLSAVQGASGRAFCIDALFELLVLEARDWQDDWWHRKVDLATPRGLREVGERLISGSAAKRKVTPNCHGVGSQIAMDAALAGEAMLDSAIARLIAAAPII